jgi:hypothetical protein
LQQIAKPGFHSRIEGDGPLNELQLINISETADAAFQNFDWSEHQEKGVRLFIQGFG